MATPILVTSVSDELRSAFQEVTCVAMDIEGVDLGRAGRCSLLQISPSPDKCFVCDVLNMDGGHELVCFLRCILESKSIVKIIHDCRMDSDALFHLLGIELTNVHDTSCWHWMIKGTENVSLNNLLASNGLKLNAVRDSNVYQKNHAFWASRPLTASMLEWAAGDISSLFMVYGKQMEDASAKTKGLSVALSDKYLNKARSAKTAFFTVKNPGRFIGPGGSNLRLLGKIHDVLMYQRGKRDTNTWMVYYHTADGLSAVMSKASA